MKTLSGAGKLLAAARHNKRAIQKELGASGHIDATKSYLNYSLLGVATALDVAKRAKSILKSMGIAKLRKNAVCAIEIVFSLPATARIDHRTYFEDCRHWASEQFGGDNILSADVHLDEAAPHCHILLLPLLDGRMRGSDLMGNRQTLQARQTSFYEQVSQRHGLSKPQNSRMSLELKERAKGAVLAHLQATGDAARKSCAWPLISDMIAHDPLRWADCLGIEIQACNRPKKTRTMAQIFTGKGKGAQIEQSTNKTPIGFQGSESSNPYHCVGVLPEPSFLHKEENLAIEVRDRETDCTPDQGFWDENTGEWRKFIKNTQATKLAAQQWVEAGLQEVNTASRPG